MPDVHAGFIPLSDCAPLVIARELGIDHEHGINLVLHKEASWANIRDKVEVGLLDCAHMLAPMPIAASLGIGHVKVPLIAPMSLGLNGNAITVCETLYAHMMDLGAEHTLAGGMASAQALSRVVAERASSGQEPLTFAMVYPFSCHNYELRYWLAAAGIDPEKDVRLVVIPPPLMVESLKEGHIHGFCVGEPWNSIAVASGIGHIVATKIELWRNSPEKVLGMRLSWAERDPELMSALIRTLHAACKWLDGPNQRSEAAALLSSDAYLGVDAELLKRALTGSVLRSRNAASDDETDFLTFHRHQANFPWISHAIWMMTQMVRWGQATGAPDIKDLAARIYRPDIYRQAIGDAEVLPESDMKPETWFGGEGFDPDDPQGYLDRFAIHHRHGK